MNIPEGFTPRGDSNEQPPETYDKRVRLWLNTSFGVKSAIEAQANRCFWKVPDGPLRIVAYEVLV